MKSLQKLETKAVKNIQTVKGGDNGGRIKNDNGGVLNTSICHL